MHCKWWLARCGGRLPFAWRWAAAQRLASLFLKLESAHLQFLKTNLSLCFPQWTNEQRQAFMQTNANEAAFATFNQFRCWSLTAQEIRQQVTLENAHWLRAWHDLGPQRGPLVLLCPHFLGLEFAAHRVAMEVDLVTLYSPCADPAFDALRLRARRRFDACHCLPHAGSMRPMLRLLRQGTPLLLLADLDHGPQGSVFSPFFGVPAATTRTTAWCAVKAGATVMPVSVRRVAQDQYVTTLHPPLCDLGPDITSATHRISAATETLVRAAPEHYWWSQPRFATRPAGHAPLYPDETLLNR
jgi:Kdo2-lipid IVA lauroyltransferase/acyltransferase